MAKVCGQSKEIKKTLQAARDAGLRYIDLRNRARDYEQRLLRGRIPRCDRDGCKYEPRGNAVERGLCTAADLASEADKAAKALSEPYIRASRLICLLDDDRLRAVLDSYYLHCRSWKRIADGLGVSVRHVHRLHGRALEGILSLRDKRDGAYSSVCPPICQTAQN